jgi:release factor glutamine methyltransferase
VTTLAEAMAKATAALKSAQIESARVDARVLAGHVLGPTDQLPSASQELSLGQVEAFDAAIRRRVIGEPVAYITGRKEFFGLDFVVGPGVLVPRPETETLVEEALKDFPESDLPLRVLDLGTGSGCLLIAFLKNRPAATGVAIERSGEALKWCKRNMLQHYLKDRCELLEADWSERIDSNFDVILANPPYIETGHIAGLSPDVRSFEPLPALDGGLDGLDAYRSLGPILFASLAPDGRAYLEIGQGQHHIVAEVMEAAGLNVARVTPDLAGIPRCVVVRRLENAS